MDSKQYMNVWKVLSTKKQILPGCYVGNGRRDEMHLEEPVNALCRNLTAANRAGPILISLDDDKIHAFFSSVRDKFGLKYVFHNRANRKGLVAHTAATTSLIMPVGVCFERTGDNKKTCFKRLLLTLFKKRGPDDGPDLKNVIVASDRAAYMVPHTIFPFLLYSGVNLIGTTKRLLQCFPFTFDQNVRTNDPRKIIDKNGGATLYVKKNILHEQKYFYLCI